MLMQVTAGQREGQMLFCLDNAASDHTTTSRDGSNLLVGTYVKERDNNKMKGGETGVIFWSKVYCLSMRDMGEAHIPYINGR